MDRITSAIKWLALAVFLHGCMDSNTTRVYIEEALQKTETK